MNLRRRKQAALTMLYFYGACLLLPPVPLHATEFPRGDVNGDGEINSGDLPELRDFILRRNANSRTLSQGDFNQDGRIDGADLLAIRTYDGDFDGDTILDPLDPFPTNPVVDTDEDGIGDVAEIDPDNDGYGESGLPPGFEGAYRVDAGAVLNIPGATTDDSDGDGLSNEDEDTSYTFHYLPPLEPGERIIFTDSLLPDTDRDGLTDGDEKNGTTDALNPDTDGDGVLDGPDANPTDPGINRTKTLRGRAAKRNPRLTATQTEKNNAWIAALKQKYAEHLKRAAEFKRQGKEAPRFELAAPTGGSARGLGFAQSSSIGSNFDSVQSDQFTGAFSYSIPIKVPPGRNGMQPELAFVYRSTNSHSWVGMGWDLNPGRIERSTKDGAPKYTNPSDPPPNDEDSFTPLDNPDTFLYTTAAGGSELVFTGSLELETEETVGVYHAVVDSGSFVRFLHHPDGNYWEAQGKDGRRSFFGGTDSSNPVSADFGAVIQHPTHGIFSWALAEEWDLNGDANKITYGYEHPAGTNNMYLDSVQYNYAGGSPQVTIDLITQGRSDDPTLYSYRESFKSKQKIISDRFLTSILQTVENRSTVSAPHPNRVRRYDLGYRPLNPDYGVTISCLSSVQEFGETDSDAFPAITMTFSENNGDWDYNASPSGPYALPNPFNDFALGENYGSVILDYNADGLPDVLWHGKYQGAIGHLAIAENTGSGWNYSTDPDAPYQIPDTITDYGWSLDYGGRAMDFNGDGRTDILWSSEDGNVDGRRASARNTGDDWDYNASPSDPYRLPEVFNDYGLVFDYGGVIIDCNGDSLPDVLWNTNSLLGTALNTGNGWSYSTDPGASYRLPRTITDYPSRLDFGARVMDFNGDGLTDMLWSSYLNHASARSYRMRNTGQGWEENASPSDPYWLPTAFNDYGDFGDHFGENYGAVIIDYNGDGLTDVLWHSNANGGSGVLRKALNTGSGWSDITDPGAPYQLPAAITDYIRGQEFGARAMDYDGDGLTDVLWSSLENHTPGRHARARNAGKIPNLLTSIDNGIGGTVEIEYSPQTKGWMRLYDPDASRRVEPDANGFETNNHVPYVVQTVSKITRTSRRPNNVNPADDVTSGTLNESYTTLYRYSGGKHEDREFRGFGKVKEIDAQTGNFTITEFHQDYARKGMPRSVRSYVGARQDYRTDGDTNGPIRSRNDAPANFETVPAFDEPKIVSETYNRYRVAINANDPNPLKPFNMLDDYLGIEIPEGMTLVTPASTISRVYEYSGNYGQDSASVPALVTAQEHIFDLRGNPTEVINYGKVNVVDSELQEPRSDTTFADDMGPGADGRVADMTTYKQGLDRTLTWMDVPETVNKSGFHTLPDGSRETAILKTLQAQTIAYDGLLRPSSVTRHLNTGPSPITQYEYDAFGNVTRIVDPKGNESLTSYETQYNTFPETMTNDLGHATSYVVDPGFGNLLEKTDPNGRTRSAAYDGLGRMTAMRDSSGTTVTTYQYAFWSFSGSGAPGDFFYPSRVRTTTHTPTGNVFSEEHFDGLARKYQTLSVGQRGAADPIRTVAEFNDRGLHWRQSHPHWMTDAGSEHWTVTFYENDDIESTGAQWSELGLNRPVQSVRELSAFQTETALTVYETPLQAKSINARGHEARVLRDAFGNRVAVTEPGSAPGSAGTVDEADARTTQYGYDGLGRLEHVRRAFGENPSAQDPVTKITYDTLSRRTRLDDPDSGVSEYQFDANGNLTSSVDARGEFVVRSYDSLNRLATVNYFEGAALRTHQYTYDAGPGTNLVGRLAAVEDPACLARYSYDNEGRTIEVSRTIDGQTYTSHSAWDYAGREIVKTYPETSPGTGMQLEYGFDANTQALETVEIPGGQVFLADKQASQFGSVETFLLGNGVERMNFFDYAGRAYRLLTTSGAGTLSDLAYSFDENSNISRIQESAGPAPFGDMQYEYDPLNRLTKAYGTTMSGANAGNAGAPFFAYSYDALGRMTSNARFTNPAFAGTTPQYAYASDPAASGPYHAVQSIILDHATNPDVTAHQFTYDAAGNQLSSADGPGAVAQNDLDRINTWDALGRLSSVTRGGVVTLFTYDANNNRIKKSTLGGETVTYVGDLVEVVAGQITKHVFAGSERIATIQPGGAIQFYAKDHLGSSAIITDAAGAELQRMDYEPYGALISNGRSDNAEAVRHTYTGQEADGETGLMHYNARYYDPVVGIFISADVFISSAGNPNTFNRFAYVLNNPLVYTDPTGHFSWNKFKDSVESAASDAGNAVSKAGNAYVDAHIAVFNYQAQAFHTALNTPILGQVIQVGVTAVATVYGGPIGQVAAGALLGGFERSADVTSLSFRQGFMVGGVSGAAGELGGPFAGGFVQGFLGTYLDNPNADIGTAAQNGLVSGAISVAASAAAEGMFGETDGDFEADGNKSGLYDASGDAMEADLSVNTQAAADAASSASVAKTSPSARPTASSPSKTYAPDTCSANSRKYGWDIVDPANPSVKLKMGENGLCRVVR